MSGRGRLPPHAAHDLPFGGRGPLGSMPPHPDLLDDGPPFGPPRRGPPHHHPAAVIDERLAAQHQEIQGLLVDNQRLAATHVALKQELAAAQQELQRASRAIAGMQSEKDSRFREAYERSMKMESELYAAEAMKGELMQIRGDIQQMSAERQELTGQVQALTHDLNRAASDVQQAPAIKQQIDALKQEIQHARACIEHEKKGYADSYEQGQQMQKNLVSMAREVEKLRAEVANAEKRARAAAAAGNQATGYGGNYGNPGPDPNYGGNPYPAGYSMNPVPGGADGGTQFGTGPATGSGHSSWGAYDMQRAHVLAISLSVTSGFLLSMKDDPNCRPPLDGVNLASNDLPLQLLQLTEEDAVGSVSSLCKAGHRSDYHMKNDDSTEVTEARPFPNNLAF